MTTQQITLLVLAAAGAALFFAGRYLSGRLASDERTFIPASLVTARGLAGYAATVLSWAGAFLAGACLLLLFS